MYYVHVYTLYIFIINYINYVLYIVYIMYCIMYIYYIANGTQICRDYVCIFIQFSRM